MFMRKLAVSIMICGMIFSCSTGFAAAAEIPGEIQITPQASGTVDYQISSKIITPIGDWFYASSGDSIRYDCTYTPSSANVDFGFISSDGTFYSVNCTSGKINRTLQIDQSGQYMLAIRNNASYDVVVNGTVKY